MGVFFGQGYYTGICMILISWAVLCSLQLNSGRFHWFVVLTNIHKVWNKSESWPTIREEIKKKTNLFHLFEKKSYRCINTQVLCHLFPHLIWCCIFCLFCWPQLFRTPYILYKKCFLKDVKLTVSTTKNLNKLDASISRTKIVATGSLINIWCFFLASKYSYRISQFLSSFYHLILQNMPQS